MILLYTYILLNQMDWLSIDGGVLNTTKNWTTAPGLEIRHWTCQDDGEEKKNGGFISTDYPSTDEQMYID